MTSSSTPASHKYHVQITNVREVSLFGRADLAFWKDRLQAEHLFPASEEGSAQLLISSVEARFMGILFRELSISVAVCRKEGEAVQEGYFLVQAFNSLRFFAWVERTFFRTPYYPGKIQVVASLPARAQVSQAEGTLLRAEMSAESCASGRLAREEELTWEGPIFLPRKDAGNDSAKVFFARLSGLSKVFPFEKGDVISLTPSPSAPVIGWLRDSQFAGKEWLIRTSATHGKSKTVRRSAAGTW